MHRVLGLASHVCFLQVEPSDLFSRGRFGKPA